MQIMHLREKHNEGKLMKTLQKNKVTMWSIADFPAV